LALISLAVSAIALTVVSKSRRCAEDGLGGKSDAQHGLFIDLPAWGHHLFEVGVTI
jgi:hypothetical protein